MLALSYNSHVGSFGPGRYYGGSRGRGEAEDDTGGPATNMRIGSSSSWSIQNGGGMGGGRYYSVVLLPCG